MSWKPITEGPKPVGSVDRVWRDQASCHIKPPAVEGFILGVKMAYLALVHQIAAGDPAGMMNPDSMTGLLGGMGWEGCTIMACSLEVNAQHSFQRSRDHELFSGSGHHNKLHIYPPGEKK